MPVGVCFSLTAVDTLLTFWPPAPPARKASNSMSSSLISISVSSSGSWGRTSTLANEVWRSWSALKGERRTSLWVPDSCLR